MDANERIGFSNPAKEAIFHMERTCGGHPYERLNIVVREARGSWITDSHGDAIRIFPPLNISDAETDFLARPPEAGLAPEKPLGNIPSVMSNLI